MMAAAARAGKTFQFQTDPLPFFATTACQDLVWWLLCYHGLRFLLGDTPHPLLGSIYDSKGFKCFE
jgi:hypothetical protein